MRVPKSYFMEVGPKIKVFGVNISTKTEGWNEDSNFSPKYCEYGFCAVDISLQKKGKKFKKTFRPVTCLPYVTKSVFLSGRMYRFHTVSDYKQ